ncbi:MAG TPA: hypothetical protein VH186_04620, partial [Chloroflexia bacterium]|nr:hypothetical protein [Chloroflexia bacterium]
WIGCRTQNPVMMRCYGLFGSLCPFEADYSGLEGQELIHYLRRHIGQVRDVERFDATKGICYNVYNTGRMGDYALNLNGQIEQRLAEWGFNPDLGDSLVVVARLPRVESQAIDFARPGREALLATAS